MTLPPHYPYQLMYREWWCNWLLSFRYSFLPNPLNIHWHFGESTVFWWIEMVKKQTTTSSRFFSRVGWFLQQSKCEIKKLQWPFPMPSFVKEANKGNPALPNIKNIQNIQAWLAFWDKYWCFIGSVPNLSLINISSCSFLAALVFLINRPFPSSKTAQKPWDEQHCERKNKQYDGWLECDYDQREITQQWSILVRWKQIYRRFEQFTICNLAKI